MTEYRFVESGMEFIFDESDCFHIERSETYREMSGGVKVCEAVVWNRNRILFIEAKSSFPKPGSQENFQQNLSVVCEKFLHSVLLYAGLAVGRPYSRASTLPVNLSVKALKTSPMIFYLIINGFKEEWIVNIHDAVNKKCAALKKVFKIDYITVINDRTARKYGLIL